MKADRKRRARPDRDAGWRPHGGHRKGLALAYRRTAEGYGTWSARLLLPGGKYALKALGSAVDFQDAGNTGVLTFFQAQDRGARDVQGAKRSSGVGTSRQQPADN